MTVLGSPLQAWLTELAAGVYCSAYIAGVSWWFLP